MIEVIRAPADMRRRADELRARGRTIAVVPTMGALHEGHLSLLRLAATLADDVVLTLFINPKQFSPDEDLHTYPKQEALDLKLAAAAGATTAFCPGADAMYPSGYQTHVDVGALSLPMCGGGRPGHFRGVTTIVTKLFNITKPHVAVFGQKDFQQLALLRRIVLDLDFGIDIIGAPIVRESDGLAMSSRNAYLSASERAAALSLSRGLNAAAMAHANGEINVKSLVDIATAEISTSAVVEYLDIYDANTLEALRNVDRPAVIAIAARIGTTRLIDNVLLEP